MVSASKAARQAKRAAEGKDPKKPSKTLKSKLDRSEPNSTDASKNASKASSVNGDVGESEAPMLDADEEFIDEKVKKLALQEDKDGLSDRVTTGVLASQEASRDVKISSSNPPESHRQTRVSLPRTHRYLPLERRCAAEYLWRA